MAGNFVFYINNFFIMPLLIPSSKLLLHSTIDKYYLFMVFNES